MVVSVAKLAPALVSPPGAHLYQKTTYVKKNCTVSEWSDPLVYKGSGVNKNEATGRCPCPMVIKWIGGSTTVDEPSPSLQMSPPSSVVVLSMGGSSPAHTMHVDRARRVTSSTCTLVELSLSPSSYPPLPASRTGPLAELTVRRTAAPWVVASSRTVYVDGRDEQTKLQTATAVLSARVSHCTCPARRPVDGHVKTHQRD